MSKNLPMTEALILSAYFHNNTKSYDSYYFNVLNNRKYSPAKDTSKLDAGYFSRKYNGGAHFCVQYYKNESDSYKKFDSRQYYYLTHAQIHTNDVQYMEVREDLIKLWRSANEHNLTVLSVSDTGALWVIPVADLIKAKPSDVEVNLQCNRVFKYNLSASPDYVYNGYVSDNIKSTASYISESWKYMGHFNYCNNKYQKQSTGYTAVYGGAKHPYKSAKHIYDELLAPMGYTKSYEALKKSLYRNNHTFRYTRESDGLEVVIRLSKDSDFIGLKKVPAYKSVEETQHMLDEIADKISKKTPREEIITTAPAVSEPEPKREEPLIIKTEKVSWKDWVYDLHPDLMREYGSDIYGYKRYLKAVS